MSFSFCPHCGTQLQSGFRFCPSCGEKIPCPVDGGPGPAVDGGPGRLGVSSSPHKPNGGGGGSSTIEISSRPPLRKTRGSVRLVHEEKLVSDDYTVAHASPAKTRKVTWNLREEMEPALESSSPPPVSRSPRSVMGKDKASKRVHPLKQTDEEKAAAKDEDMPKAPSRDRGKAKKNRRSVSSLEPLQEGEELTDTTGRKWRLMRLLSQSTTELFYEVTSGSASKGSSHVLKLGAKDGRIFNEQNFLQRAAKPSSVDKWKKRLKMDFLGIPSCVGFGLHADNYRFLIFPNMGQPLQSIMEEEELLSEKVILHLACTILDVLEYVHSNEYVHGDIHAENVYVTSDEQSQVYLAGYCHAFRYCPSGQHVEYREASRTLHEGAAEFISLDSHRGAGPSRRSDLQSLAYCLLRWHTGSLPWTALTNADQIAKEKHRYRDDISALLTHCFGKRKVSAALKTYVTAVMALNYTETPDYAGLREGLSEALLKLGGSLEQPLEF